MFCKYCGKEIKDNAEFCPYCGKPQTSGSAEKPGKNVEKGPSTSTDKDDSKETAQDKTVKTAKTVKDSKGSKKRSPLKIGLIVAACVVVVAGVAAGIIIARNGSNNANDSTAEAGAAKTVDLSNKSGDYTTAYKYVSENACKIIQREMQNSVLSDSETSAFYGQYRDETGEFIHPIDQDEETFEAYVDDLDSQKFETYIEQKSSDLSYSFPDYFLDDKGIVAYFNDIDIVKEFRDVDDSIYEVCITNGFQWDELNKDSEDFVTDESVVLCINGDYAFVRSQHTVEDIVRLMSYLSGYQTVYSVVHTLVADTDGYEDNDVVEGRKDALTEYLDKWDDAHTQWETEFLETYGIEGKVSDVNGNFDDAEFDENTLFNDTEFDENSLFDDAGEDAEEDQDADEDDTDDADAEGTDDADEDFEEDTDTEEDTEDADEDAGENDDTNPEEYEGTIEDYIYQVVDRDGNNYYSFSYGYFSDSVTINLGADGKVQIYLNDGDVNRILFAFDKEGNSIYDYGQALYYPSKKEWFSYISMQLEPGEVIGITPSGNGLASETGNNLELGDYYSLLWVKADGSTEELMKTSGIKPVTPVEDEEENLAAYYYNTDNTNYYLAYPKDYIYTDEWKVSYGTFDSIDTDDEIYGDYSGYIIINLETGEYTKDKEKVFDVFNPQDYEEDEDKEEEVVVPDSYVKISPDYYMDTATWDVYSKDNMDSRVARLDEGQGVERLIYNEEQDIYWVITNTSYYYKLNGDFSQAADPRLLESDDVFLCPYGVFTIDNDIGTLLDENGDTVLESRKSGNMLACGFATKDLNDAYNLSNNEYIRITKDETE